MTFMTALTQPLMAVICAGALIFGRFIYSIGYCKFGPTGRIVGAIIVDLALIAVFVGSIMSIASWPTDKAKLLRYHAKTH